MLVWNYISAVVFGDINIETEIDTISAEKIEDLKTKLAYPSRECYTYIHTSLSI